MTDQSTRNQNQAAADLLFAIFRAAWGLGKKAFRVLGNLIERVAGPVWLWFAQLDEADRLVRLQIAAGFVKQQEHGGEATTAGIKDGERGWPVPSSLKPEDSAYLSTLFGEALRVATYTRDLYEKTLQSLRQKLMRPMEPLANEVQLVIRQTRDVDLRSNELRYRDRIIEAYKSAEKAKRTYSAWISTNKLTRDEPDQPDLVRSFLVIVFATLMEALGTGYLLSDYAAQGLRGSLTTCLAISVVNVAVGLAAGWAFGRERYHARWYRRAIGWLGSIAYFAVAVVGHLGFTAARHLMLQEDRDMAEAFAEVGAFLMHNNWSWLMDLASIGFVSLGIAIAGLSWLKGHTAFEDVYPGFTTAFRRMRYQAEAADELQEEFERNAETIQADAFQALDELQRSAETDAEGLRKTMSMLERVTNSMSREVGVLNEGIHRLFGQYVRDNTRTRGDMPSPTWFSRVLNLPLQWQVINPATLDQFIVAAEKRVNGTQLMIIEAKEALIGSRVSSVLNVREAKRRALGEPEIDDGWAALPALHDSQLRGGSGITSNMET